MLKQIFKGHYNPLGHQLFSIFGNVGWCWLNYQDFSEKKPRGMEAKRKQNPWTKTVSWLHAGRTAVQSHLFVGITTFLFFRTTVSTQCGIQRLEDFSNQATVTRQGFISKMFLRGDSVPRLLKMCTPRKRTNDNRKTAIWRCIPYLIMVIVHCHDSFQGGIVCCVFISFQSNHTLGFHSFLEFGSPKSDLQSFKQPQSAKCKLQPDRTLYLLELIKTPPKTRRTSLEMMFCTPWN